MSAVGENLQNCGPHGFRPFDRNVGPAGAAASATAVARTTATARLANADRAVGRALVAAAAWRISEPTPLWKLVAAAMVLVGLALNLAAARRAAPRMSEARCTSLRLGSARQTVPREK